jgi:small nuclear ribonucleoprotein D3
MVIGVPVKLLHEAYGLHVTVELQTGQSYRGRLTTLEDNMNCQLKEVTLTARDGHQSALEHVFIRGSQVRFFVVPDNLRHVPAVKEFGKEKKGKGMGMGYGHDQIKAAQANRR